MLGASDPRDMGSTVATIGLHRSYFGDKDRRILAYGGLEASLFKYDTGVEAVRIAHPRGHVIVLPYMGQIVWDAAFDGVRMAMDSMFDAPRPARTIVETYGALAYHAGLLRNGVPGANDDHPLHGEMPCAPMTAAGLSCGTDAGGAFLAVTGEYDYAMGFGAHYRARPRVLVRAEAPAIEIVMEVENLSAKPMDLMYLCHVNFAFVAGGRIVQPVPYDPASVVARTAIPSFVTASDDYRALIDELARNPGRMEVLDEPDRYDPEQVFYVKGLRPGPDGLVHFAMLRPQGDAITIAYDPVAMPHTIRWVLAGTDQRVAAFAMPATCEPEGYRAELRKGNVRSLAGGAVARFETRLGYADRQTAPDIVRRIEAQRTGGPA